MYGTSAKIISKIMTRYTFQLQSMVRTTKLTHLWQTNPFDCRCSPLCCLVHSNAQFGPGQTCDPMNFARGICSRSDPNPAIDDQINLRVEYSTWNFFVFWRNSSVSFCKRKRQSLLKSQISNSILEILQIVLVHFRNLGTLLDSSITSLEFTQDSTGVETGGTSLIAVERV